MSYQEILSQQRSVIVVYGADDTSFLQIDRDHSGAVSFDEFFMWLGFERAKAARGKRKPLKLPTLSEVGI